MASHDATAKEYIVINSSAGHLRDSIIAANKDFRELQNLKITGGNQFRRLLFHARLDGRAAITELKRSKMLAWTIRRTWWRLSQRKLGI